MGSAFLELFPPILAQTTSMEDIEWPWQDLPLTIPWLIMPFLGVPPLVLSQVLCLEASEAK